MGVHRHPEYQCFWPRMTTAIHRLVGYPIASLLAERSLTLVLRFVERGGVRRTGEGGTPSGAMHCAVPQESPEHRPVALAWSSSPVGVPVLGRAVG